MFELCAAPSKYDSSVGGVRAGDDVVRLFAGATAVLARCAAERKGTFASTAFAAASSTTEPQFARRCLQQLPVQGGGTVGELFTYTQIYPGSKGRQHFPALQRESGVPYSSMIFFDDCTYGDNCGDVARLCTGALCVRTPDGLTEERFQAALDAFALGQVGVL
uniref:Uncharacterized protein n=1 Tax=Calcidiscus leptoporus TaxID=127549 RepID=A0A7S0INU0_9EUKA|mmetsp:Transcript_1369/g.3132  ORF Transcript_1369/g.3132 Transcript_1369/m.3132 type:complete len:163 (+) Transcript_1369:154-642(+)